MHRYLIFYTAFTLLTTALLGRAATEHVIYAPPPEYPAEARARHLTGSGDFAVQIRPDGSVERVDTVKSSVIHRLMMRLSPHFVSGAFTHRLTGSFAYPFGT